MTIKDLPEIIKTERLEMRQLEPTIENAKLVFDALKNEVDDDYLWGPVCPGIHLYVPRTADDMLKQMKLDTEWNGDNGASFYIFHKGELVGYRRFQYFPNNKTFQFNVVWFVKSSRNKGFAKESMKTFEKIAFTNFGAHRTSRFCYPQNTASIKLSEDMGYHLDGIARHSQMHTDGTFHDSMFWSKLESEYKE